MTNEQHPIPVYRPSLIGNERKYVNECLDSTWISSKGEFLQRFEQCFAQYIGASNATAVANGTVALHLALAALDIGPGDEVIVPTLTYVASVNTILQVGATPVFVDSLQDTWQMDPNDVRRKLTSRTRAVMVVHLYGQACEMSELTAICRTYDLRMIEDCAEAFGSYYAEQHVGTFGDVATFSFFGNKTITTGEGGMVVCRETELHSRAVHLKNQGVSAQREYWHDTLAFNYRMTNICAAIGLAQLERADQLLARKREVAEAYQQRLSDLPLTVHAEVRGTRHSFWMCSVALKFAEQREALREALTSAKIETRPLFPPAHTLPHLATGESFPVAESLSERGMNLPSYPSLSDADLERICNTIRKFFVAPSVSQGGAYSEHLA